MTVNLSHVSLQGAFHCLGMFISCAAYLLFNVIFDSLCISCLHPSDPYWETQHSLASPVFCFTLLIVVVIALAPRWVN